MINDTVTMNNNNAELSYGSCSNIDGMKNESIRI